ncbi:MAG TPA: tetratricopeptide repeat protein [Pyrinomonadaceae bacterium]|nr:tetratricopeptide repeat protein [Pyrinomonadaceae bacterium]
MSARAQTRTLRLSLFATVFVLFLHAALAGALSHTFGQQTDSASAARVAQVVEQVRGASLTDDAVTSALSLGYRLNGEGRYAEAAELFGALVARRPGDGAALYGAALAAFNLGRTAEAEALARRAVDALLPAGTDARASGLFARAEDMRAADALVLLAVALAVRGDNAGALKTVERAARLAPEHFDAQLALGRALYGAGDDAGAARAFRSAVALRPSDARARFFLATALERAGDADGALAAYRELASGQPRVAEGHLGLGVLLTKRGGADAEEGLKELERALALKPDLYEARVTLGRALVSRGRAAEAIEHLRRASELAPENPEPHYQLSLAYRRLGRSEDAAAESAIVKRIHESRRAAGARNVTPATPED